MRAMPARAFITGISGPSLTSEERDFLRAERPWGFILFKRNIENQSQVSAFVMELREAVEDSDALATVAALILEAEENRRKANGRAA